MRVHKTQSKDVLEPKEPSLFNPLRQHTDKYYEHGFSLALSRSLARSLSRARAHACWIQEKQVFSEENIFTGKSFQKQHFSDSTLFMLDLREASLFGRKSFHR